MNRDGCVNAKSCLLTKIEVKRDIATPEDTGVSKSGEYTLISISRQHFSNPD
jgi:hypothetical protein